MNFKSFTVLLLVVTLASVPGSAQSQSTTPATMERNELTPEEKQALEKKAIASLDDLVAEGMGLRMAENRIPVLLFAADMLWKHDEKRARGYMQEAVNQYLTLGPISLDKTLRAVPAARTRQSLRNRLVITVAQFDPRMALDFLRSSRAQTPTDGQTDVEDEKQLEIRLAAQIAESDPQMALQLAQEALRREPDSQLVEIWRRLQRKDPKVAASLANEIVAKLKSADLMKNYGAAAIINDMTDDLRQKIRGQKNPKADSGQSPEPQVPAQELEQTLRALLELVVVATLKITPTNLMDVNDQGPARSVLAQAQSLLPDIDKYLPSRASILRNKLNQFDSSYYHPPTLSDSYEELEKRSTTELMAMAEKSKGEAKDLLYSHAMMKALQEEHIDLAKQISSQHLKGSDDFISHEIDRLQREKAVKEGRIEEARKTIDELPSEAERALSLTSLARTTKDPQIQRQLLNEARGVLGDRLETRGQVEAQVILAASFLPFDPDYSFAQLSAAIEKLNSLISASIMLMKYTQELRTEDEEMRLSNSGLPDWFTGGIDHQILAFARKDFGRTQTAIAQWQHDQMRLSIRMMLIAAILSRDNSDLRQRYLLGQDTN